MAALSKTLLDRVISRATDAFYRMIERTGGCPPRQRRQMHRAPFQGSATIDTLIAAAALAGDRVLRLKSGDPSIFGRSTEEIDARRTAGATVRICPGIVAAGAATATGLTALTLRGMARRLTFVTAHAQGDAPLDLDWQALAAPDAPLAVYMGPAAVAAIAAGLAPGKPVMIAINLSLASERLIRGRLDALAFLVETIGDRDPAALLISEAVGPAQFHDQGAGVPHTSPSPHISGRQRLSAPRFGRRRRASRLWGSARPSSCAR